VHFLGLVPKYEIAAWYKVAWASFVVFKDRPVLGTVSPNKMFDSFAAGVPIIQNTQGWIRELVEETGCGLNVIPADSVSMAGAIEAICADEAESDRMGAAARDLASTRFNRDRLSEVYLEALTAINNRK
jgi:glycosyltransferase involved in cell wall biosynthesis